MNRIYIFIIALSVSMSTEASFGSSCSTFLNKLVELVGLKTYAPPQMTRETQESFRILKKKNLKEIKNVSYNDVTSPEGRYLLSILPKEVLEYMKQMPK